MYKFLYVKELFWAILLKNASKKRRTPIV